MDANDAVLHDAYGRARQMYVEHVPIRDICTSTGLKQHQLYAALAGGPYVAPGRRLFAEIARDRIVRRKPKAKPPADRAAVVARLWKSAERQVADIDKRLRKAGVAAVERERDARMLAVMVKTLRELSALDDRKAGAHERGDDDTDSRDIDEFRRELARRIDALAAEQDGETDRRDVGS